MVWSPDSRYLAVTRTDSARQLPQIVLLDPATGKHDTITSDRYESFSPALSRDGRWLYFLSNRSFQSSVGSPWGDRNTGAFFDRRTRAYAYALQVGTRFPFQAPNELQDAREVKAADKAESAPAKDAKADALPAIAFEGLRERLFELPLESGNYDALVAAEDRLYFLQRDAGPRAKGQL